MIKETLRKVRDFLGIEDKEEIESIDNFLYEENRGDYREFRNSSIKMNVDIYRKLYYYTCAAKGEISGLFKIKIINRDITITDVALFKQTCSGASTDLNQEILHKFVVDLIRKKENPNDWRGWWHSHNDFGAGWSGIDDNNIEQYSKKKLLVSICTDKSGNMVGRIDKNGKTTDLPIYINIGGLHTSLAQKCIKEVKEKVEDNSFCWNYGRESNYDKEFNVRSAKKEGENIKININEKTKVEETDGLHTSIGFSDYE